MCACKQKRASFLIEDILCETKPHKHLSHESLESITCSKKPEVVGICEVLTPVIEFADQYVTSKQIPKVPSKGSKGFSIANLASQEPGSCKGLTSLTTDGACKFSISNLTSEDFGRDCTRLKTSTHASKSNINEELITKLNVGNEVQRELEMAKLKVNLEQRRNTYPIYPTPIKANLPWPPYRLKNPSYPLEARHPMSFYSDPMLKSEQILRNQLAVNRLVANPYSLRQVYGFDRVPPSCCSPWWGVGGRRKGGQVRFSAAQTGALERRFSASKYLSPDERRALAASLRLSDRQEALKYDLRKGGGFIAERYGALQEREGEYLNIALTIYTITKVKTWFQNRRAKWRRTTPEMADPGSPPTADESDDDVQIADDD